MPEISTGRRHLIPTPRRTVSGRGHMNAQPNFDEALRRQWEVFADRYAADSDLQKYADAAFGNTDNEGDDSGD
jgi:hypothetical protein